MFLTLGKLAFRNLFRQKRRNLLVIFIIGASFAAVLLISAQCFRVYHHIDVADSYANDLGHVAIFRAGGLLRQYSGREKYLISKTDQDFLTKGLASFSEVEFVSRYLSGVGLVSNGCESIPYVGLGIDLNMEDRVHGHPSLRKWLSTVDRSTLSNRLSIFKLKNVIAMTPSMANALRKSKTLRDLENSPIPPSVLVTNCNDSHTRALSEQSPEVQLLANKAGGDTSVSDAYIAYQFSTGRAFSDDVALRTSLEDMQNILGTTGVSYIAVFLNDPSQRAAFIEQFEREYLRSRTSEFSLHSSTSIELDDLGAGIIGWHQTLELFTHILLGLIVAVVTVNFITMTIRERRSEIGTMLALGFKPRAIILLFQKESLLIILAGIACGALFTGAVIYGVNHLQIQYPGPGMIGNAIFLLGTSAERLAMSAGFLVIGSMVCSLVSINWIIRGQSINRMLAGSA